MQLAAFTIRFVTEKCESGLLKRMLGVCKTLTKITRNFSHNAKFIIYVKTSVALEKALEVLLNVKKSNGCILTKILRFSRKI